MPPLPECERSVSESPYCVDLKQYCPVAEL